MAAVTVIAHWKLDPADLPELRPVIDRLVQATRAEPGCRSYRLYEDERDPASLTLVEEYADAAAVEAHRASEHFQVLVLKTLAPRLRQRDVIRLRELR